MDEIFQQESLLYYCMNFHILYINIHGGNLTFPVFANNYSDNVGTKAKESSSHTIILFNSNTKCISCIIVYFDINILNQRYLCRVRAKLFLRNKMKWNENNLHDVKYEYNNFATEWPILQNLHEEHKSVDIRK